MTEIRRGKKEERKKPQDKNIMAGHKKLEAKDVLRNTNHTQAAKGPKDAIFCAW